MSLPVPIRIARDFADGRTREANHIGRSFHVARKKKQRLRERGRERERETERQRKLNGTTLPTRNCSWCRWFKTTPQPPKQPHQVQSPRLRPWCVPCPALRPNEGKARRSYLQTLPSCTVVCAFPPMKHARGESQRNDGGMTRPTTRNRWFGEPPYAKMN